MEIEMERKKIAIVGVGLIGGSLAIQLHEKKLSSRLIGVDANTEHAQQALALELVDEILPLDEAITAADVVVLAIPVDKLVSLLPDIMNKIDRQIVMDMGSTKAQLINVIKDHPKRGRYVATHPMWGTEYSGPGAAVRGAYENKAVIICNSEESDADALAWVKHMYKKIGMHLLEMEAKAHDLHAAYVSHISHITSFALANTVLEKEKEEQAIFELASAGFESTVRLAKSNPAMWVPIFMQNRENVLDVLKEHIAQLTRFKESIEKNDNDYLMRLIEDANKIKRILK
jgi:prephenate dehydrogenase